MDTNQHKSLSSIISIIYCFPFTSNIYFKLILEFARRQTTQTSYISRSHLEAADKSYSNPFCSRAIIPFHGESRHTERLSWQHYRTDRHSRVRDAKEDIFAKTILTPYNVSVSKTYLKRNYLYIFLRVRQYNTEDFAAHLSELEAYTLRTIAVHIRGPGQRSRYSDSLRAGRSGDPIPVGARFSAPVQTGP